MRINSEISEVAHKTILRTRLLDISRALNGNIDFGSPLDGQINIHGSWITAVTPGGANTEFTVTHNLGFVPSLLIWNLDKAGSVYASRRTSWTTTQAFFKSDATTANLVGFLF